MCSYVNTVAESAGAACIPCMWCLSRAHHWNSDFRVEVIIVSGRCLALSLPGRDYELACGALDTASTYARHCKSSNGSWQLRSAGCTCTSANDAKENDKVAGPRSHVELAEVVVVLLRARLKVPNGSLHGGPLLQM